MAVLQEILTDLKAVDKGRRALRKFGVITGLVLVVLAALVMFKHRGDPVMFTRPVMVMGIAGAVCLGAGLAAPTLLKHVHLAFSFIGLCIAWLVTRLALLIMFYIVFFPVGLVFRIIGKDGLRRRLDPDIRSYWIQRPDEPFDPARCRRLF